MTAILGVVALGLLMIIVFQIAKVGELLSVVKGEKEGEVNNETNRFMGVFSMAFMIIGLVASVWSAIAYSDRYLPEAASEHGVTLDFLFNVTLFFTGIVFILTQIILFYFVYKYRSGRNQRAYFFPHSNKLEMIWTVVPSIVLTVLIVLGLQAWLKVTGPAPEGTMVVEATGQQFNWIIRYPGMDGELGTREFEEISGTNELGIVWADGNSHDDFIATEIHLPVNQPVMFKLGAKDVLHSFYLPHFRVKMDCVPGIPTQFWLTPTKTTAQMRQETGNAEFDFELACAELCGSAHWNMRKVVIVEEEADYLKWVEEQNPLYDNVKASLSEEEESDQQDNSIEEQQAQQEEDLLTAL